MSKFARLFTVFLVIGLVAACGKKEASANDVTDEKIKDFILKNPEVLVESLTKYQRSMAEGDDKDAEKELSKMDKDIYQNPNSPVYGNPNGKITVVEFFDYNCGYCKKSVPDIMKIVAENKDVKVILKELPVLGPSSETTALAALAVHDIAPEKYFAFHQALMAHEGGQNEASITNAATKAGVDPKTVLEKMHDEKYKKILDKNTEIARALKISGTPTFIVNGKFLRGAAGYEGIKSAIAK